MSNPITWAIDAASAVIDLFFVESDLVEINLTEAEAAESAQLDSLATDTTNQARNDDPRPIGMRVY